MRACCSTAGAPGNEREPARAPRLEEREASVLFTLAREGDATVAFQGLRHRLGLHQQILTRTLRRLERGGLVAKAEDGYRLTEEGYGTLAALARATRGGNASKDATPHASRQSLPVMHVLLPPHVRADALADALKGRWFKDLRWFGEKRHTDETVLTWITTEGGVLVRVRVTSGAVTVEAEADDDAQEHAFLAAPALLGALADALGKEDVLARVAAS